MKLASGGSGRMILHLICLCRDRKLCWHARGISRELRSAAVHLQHSLHRLHRCVDQVTDLSLADHAVSAIHDTVFTRHPLTRVG